MKNYFRLTCFLIFSASFLILATNGALAQTANTGEISGMVTATDGTPLPGVTVRVALIPDTLKARYTQTNLNGIFRIHELAPGSYQLRFSLLGYDSASQEVPVGTATVSMNEVLSELPLQSQEVVVTAARHPEKATNAPASITVVPAQTIQEHVLNTPTDVLASVPGIDIAHEGIAMATYSSRSFHSVFGSDMLTMNDYHSLEVPAIGGFYGILMPEIPADIERVEIVRGPGSALYGPDAAPGVIHFISKSPFSSQGTDVSVAGGERNYFDGTMRFDQAIGDNFAFKVSGHILKATDWSIADDPKEDTARMYAQQALHPPAGSLSSDTITSQPVIDSLNRIGNRDSSLEVYSLEARADAILGDNATANVTAGLTRIVDDVALTEDFGGAQIKLWQYEYILAHINDGDLFVQGSINHNNTQDSYFLATGAPIVDRSTTYDAQIQDQYNNIPFEKITYGADFKAIDPVTDGTLYGPDDGHANTNIVGAYAQSETQLDPFELVLAARLDKESALTNPIFSPHAAVVYHITGDQLVRAMYNETYLYPSETDLYSDIFFAGDPFGFAKLGLGAGPNVYYVAPYVSGLHFTANGDGSYNMYSTLDPGGPISTNNAPGAVWSKIDTLVAHEAPSLLGDPALGKFASAIFNTIAAPTNGQVGTHLAYLNLNTTVNHSQFLPTTAPIDISPVQAQHQRTFELDYEGSIANSVQYEVDAYQTHYTAIRASTVALTPNVFMDSAQLFVYLRDSLSARLKGVLPDSTIAQYASQFAGGLAQVPIGVVQATGGAPDEAHPYDVLTGTRSYLTNAIEWYGIDFFTTIKANDDWSFDGSFSWLSQNYWYASALNSNADSTLQSPFSLNMPKYRFSVGAKYSGLKGFDIELRDRWSDAFAMNDNYYVGNVGARHVLDLTADYRIQSDNSSWNNLLLTLSITNVLNNVHQEFIGAPYIGRLAVLRAAYTLPGL